MPYPVVIVDSFSRTRSNDILMYTVRDGVITDRPFPRRYYNFNMVIIVPFPYNSTSRLLLTDNDSENVYYLVDRLNKPIVSDQLQHYASNRRCLACQFDSVTSTIKILSCICPTDRFISEWVNPTDCKDPVLPELIEKT